MNHPRAVSGAVLVTLALLMAGSAAGQEIERLNADGDAAQSFALYVPTAYSEDSAWPVVFVMDPRGNALPALRRLAPAAERLGYIVASSYNTASDVAGDPNTPALNAMISTVQRRYRLDTRRFYLVGMSGTARYAWTTGYAARSHIAGVAGFAAGPPPDMDLEAAVADFGAPFVFYGGVGDSDFNHPEMVLLESRLEVLDYPHHIARYPGPHGWPGAEDALSEALSWFHLQAMKRGLIGVDDDWVRGQLKERFAEASALHADSAHGAAWLSYRAIAVDFDGLADVADAAAWRDRLGDRGDVRKWRAERERLAEAHVRYKTRATGWLQEAQTSEPSLGEALQDLAVDSLLELTNARDSLLSAAAARALTDLYSTTSFYFARYHIDRRDWPRARLTLQIANHIHPGRPRVCDQLAIVANALRERVAAEGCAVD